MRGTFTRRSSDARGRRLPAGALAAAAALSLTLAGCSADSSKATGASSAVKVVPVMSITASPVDGTSGVLTNIAPKVTAAGGKLSKVVLRDGRGRVVPGKIVGAGSSWQATGKLVPGVTYTVEAFGLDSSGRQIRQKSSFTTENAKKVVAASVTPLGGQTVGIGQPIVVKFSRGVKDHAAVERRLLVETSEPVVGAWHWMSDKTVHYRPREYWPAHTTVTVRTNLKNVNVGRDIWGEEDRKVSFKIGRSQISTVDVERLTMTVVRDGKEVRTFPVSTGKEGFRTRGGKKVVLATERSKTMDATSIGISPGSSEYYRLFVEYAVRVTWSGEFVHAAPWSVRHQGKRNVSHGCVGMSMDNARWFYDHTIIGDVVDTVNSPREMELRNGFGDWNMSWADWVKGSALEHEVPTEPADSETASGTAETAPEAGLAAAKAPAAQATVPAAPKPGTKPVTKPATAKAKPAAAKPAATEPAVTGEPAEPAEPADPAPAGDPEVTAEPSAQPAVSPEPEPSADSGLGKPFGRRA